MTHSEGNFLQTSFHSGKDHILVGNETFLDIDKIGYCRVAVTSHLLHLCSTFHVPNISYNLISVNKLCVNNNCLVTFESSSASVKEKSWANLSFKIPVKAMFTLCPIHRCIPFIRHLLLYVNQEYMASSARPLWCSCPK